MPISARFLADFTQFDTAVQGAGAKLKTFESAADKAGGRLMDLGDKGQAAAPRIGSMTDSLRSFDGVLSAAGLHVGPQIRALGELGEASGKSALELGKLATAGLAIGVGMAAWGITRTAMEFFQLDEAVSKAWTSLLNFADKGAANAGAKADTLAAASKHAGREITSMTEALKINNQANDDLLLKWGRSKDAAGDSAKAVAGWRAEIATVTKNGDLASLTADLESQNFSVKDLSKRYGVHVEALQYFGRETKATAAAVEVQKKAAEAAAKETAAWVEGQHQLTEAFKAFNTTALHRSIELTREYTAELVKTTTASGALVLAELNAQIKLNAARGLDAVGAIKVQATALDTLRVGQEALAKTSQIGISQTAQHQVLMDDYTGSLYADAVAQDDLALAASKVNAEVAKTPAILGAAGQGAMAASAAFNQFTGSLVGSFSRMGGLALSSQHQYAQAGITQLSYSLAGMIPQRAAGGPVTGGSSYLVGERGPELYTPGASGFITPNGGGGGVTVVNHFTIIDTAENLARKTADLVQRSIMSGRKLASA